MSISRSNYKREISALPGWAKQQHHLPPVNVLEIAAVIGALGIPINQNAYTYVTSAICVSMVTPLATFLNLTLILMTFDSDSDD